MISKYRDRIPLFIFCLVVFFIMPFVYSGRTIDPEFAIRLLLSSLLVLGFSAYLVFINPKVSISDADRRIFLAIVVLLLWMAFAILNSVNKGDASSEWLRISLMFGFLFICFFLFQTTPGYIKIICFSAAVAAIIFTGHAIFQLQEVWENYKAGRALHIGIEVTSTLANKNFFSEALVLFLPFLVNGLLTSRKKDKIIFVIALLLVAFFIVLLQSIASWLGLLCSFIALIIIFRKNQFAFFNHPLSKGLKKIILITLVIIIAAGGFIYMRTSNYKVLKDRVTIAVAYIKDPSMLNATSEVNNNSAFERFIIWRNSLKMVAAYPVLGAGLNNWKLYYPKYGIAGTQYINSGLLRYEHPHNDYLLLWSEQGLPGLLIYLFLFGMIIRLGLRKISSLDHSSGRFLAFILATIVSFMVISFFGFPRSRIYPMLMLMILFAIVMVHVNESPKTVSSRRIGIVIMVVSIFALIASWYRLTGEIHSKNTVNAQINKNFARMLRESEKAASWFFPLDLSATPHQWYRGMAKFYSNDIEGALIEYEKALSMNPYHNRTLNDLGTTCERLGNREKALKYYQMALASTPMFVEGNMNICATYFNIGNIDSAYFFIDKIYKVPMSWGEENNYKNFLTAILSAKATLIIEENDSLVGSKADSILSDKKALINIYMRSKEENTPFAKYFKEALNGNRKIN